MPWPGLSTSPPLVSQFLTGTKTGKGQPLAERLDSGPACFTWRPVRPPGASYHTLEALGREEQAWGTVTFPGRVGGRAGKGAGEEPREREVTEHSTSEQERAGLVHSRCRADLMRMSEKWSKRRLGAAVRSACLLCSCLLVLAPPPPPPGRWASGTSNH